MTFRWKDYRAKGRTRRNTMTLVADEFMRRFLLHVLPGGFHRIRHYGLIANAGRRTNLARVRELLAQSTPTVQPEPQSAEASAESGRPTLNEHMKRSGSVAKCDDLRVALGPAVLSESAAL